MACLQDNGPVRKASVTSGGSNGGRGLISRFSLAIKGV